MYGTTKGKITDTVAKWCLEGILDSPVDRLGSLAYFLDPGHALMFDIP